METQRRTALTWMEQKGEDAFQLKESTGPMGPAGPQGPAGADGKDYVLTEVDKQEIAGMVEVTGGTVIDDTKPSTSTTYSGSKIEAVVSELNEANAKQDTEIAKKANNDDLSAVAKSGSYDDLTGKPTIPTVPESLKNPNKLKLTGAVTAEYDGSSEVSVEIPEGGSGGGATFTNTLLASGIIPADTTSGTLFDTGITLGELRKYKRFGFTVLGEAASNHPYIRLFLGSLLTVNKASNKINYLAEWEDDKRQYIREFCTTVGSGWTRLNMGYLNNSFEVYQGLSIYSKHVSGSDTDVVKIMTYNATAPADYPWELWGVIRG